MSFTVSKRSFSITKGIFDWVYQMSKNALKDRPLAIVIGGGYAGCTAAKELDKHVNTLLVDPKNYKFHNVGALRVSANAPENASTLTIPYDRLLDRGAFIQGFVTNMSENDVTLELTSKLSNKIHISFDYCVIATGSHFHFPFKTEYIYNGIEIPSLYENIFENISNAQNITIVGAGPAGVELFGEIAYLWKRQFLNKKEENNDNNNNNNNIGKRKLRLIDSNDKILANSNISDKLRDKLMKQMSEMRDEMNKLDESNNNENNIELQVVFKEKLNLEKEMSNEMNKNQSNYLISNDGKEMIIFCTGNQYINSKCYQRRFGDIMNVSTNRLECEDSLQLKGYSNIYAIGDCANMGEMRANIAELQGKTAAGNIIKQVRFGNRMKPTQWREPYPSMFVPLGKEYGACQLPSKDGKVLGKRMTSMMKGNLEINEMWSNMNYKKPLSTIDWNNIQPNSHLTTQDVDRLAHACKMDVRSFTAMVGRNDLQSAMQFK